MKCEGMGEVCECARCPVFELCYIKRRSNTTLNVSITGVKQWVKENLPEVRVSENGDLYVENGVGSFINEARRVALSKFFRANPGLVKENTDISTRQVTKAVLAGMTKEIEKELTAKYLAGVATTALAQDYNIPAHAVRDILVKNNVRPRRGRVTGLKRALSGEEQTKLIDAYINEKKSVQDLMGLFAVPIQYIRKTLKAHDVKLRRGKKGTNKPVVEKQPKKARVAKAASKVGVPIDEAKVIATYKQTGGVVAAAQKLGMLSKVVSETLKKNGFVITRGRKKL
jgi:hypothetical protein